MAGAAGLVCRRGGAAFGFAYGSSIDNLNHMPVRSISQLVKTNGKRAFLVDTLALVRKLENEGVPSKQAEVITTAITEVLNDSLENVATSFVSKGEMQRCEMIQDSNIAKFKNQVHSLQETHFSLQQREIEKLQGDIEKMRSELKHEIDKVTAGQRLDLNLERGRTRDELAKQSAETNDLTNKLDRSCTNKPASVPAAIKHIGEREITFIELIQVCISAGSKKLKNLMVGLSIQEINSLKAQLEASKYDVIKYCIGTLISISAAGLAVVRILM